MRRFATLLVVTVLLPGCQDRTSLVDPTPYSPGSVVFHAPTGGNPNFFWLQPLAASASFTGPANLALSPEIRICDAPADLDENVDACARAAAVAWFTKTATNAGSLITVVDEHYQVDWDTRATPNLPLGKNYRVFAVLGGTSIGYLDVLLAANGQQARAAGGDVFGLVGDRTLPIRFRLQQGVLASPGACELDCAEFTATNAAFEECTTNNWACLTASDGWLPAGFEEVTIVIERVRPAADAAGQCFTDIPLPQGEGCYTVTTHPDLQSAPFQSQVLWHMCQDDGLPDGYEIHQRAGNGEIRRPEVVAGNSQLDCTEFAVASSIIPDALRRLARPIGQFIFGMPLYAKDSFSAQITSFSKFVYAAAVDLQQAGTPTIVDGVMTVNFQVISDHHPDQQTPSGVEGVLVEFEVPADNGSLNVGSALSAQDGTVQVEWTLPIVDGTYEVSASIPVLVAPAGEEPSVTVQATVGDTPEIAFPAIFAAVFSNGDPVADTDVTAVRPLIDEPARVQTTGADGTTVFQQLAAGSYDVWTTADNSNVIEVTVTIPNEASAAAIGFDILPGGGGCDNGVVCGVALEAADHQITVGSSTLQLDAFAFDRVGQFTTAALTWTSSNAAVASVNAQGLVTPEAPGQATISVTANGITASLPITVFPGEVAIFN